MVIRKFGEDQSKTQLVGLFPPKFPGCGHNSLPE